MFPCPHGQPLLRQEFQARTWQWGLRNWKRKWLEAEGPLLALLGGSPGRLLSAEEQLGSAQVLPFYPCRVPVTDRLHKHFKKLPILEYAEQSITFVAKV